MQTMFFMSVSQTVLKKTNMQFHMNLKVRPKKPPQKTFPTIIKDFISSHIFLMIKVAAVSGLYAVA